MIPFCRISINIVVVNARKAERRKTYDVDVMQRPFCSHEGCRANADAHAIWIQVIPEKFVRS
jgi:hypothetical protein